MFRANSKMLDKKIRFSYKKSNLCELEIYFIKWQFCYRYIIQKIDYIFKITFLYKSPTSTEINQEITTRGAHLTFLYVCG